MSIDRALRGQPFFLGQPWLKRLLIVNVLGVVGHVLLVVWLIQKVSTLSLVPLHYTIYFGIDWLGHWRWLLLWPITMVLLVVINAFAAKKFLQRAPLLSYMLMIGAALTIYVALAAVMSVAHINL